MKKTANQASNQEMTKKIENLEAQLALLNQNLYKQTALKFIIFHSIIRGICYALGATIIAGAVLGFGFRIVSTIDYVPILNQMLSSEEVRDLLRSFKEI